MSGHPLGHLGPHQLVGGSGRGDAEHHQLGTGASASSTRAGSSGTTSVSTRTPVGVPGDRVGLRGDAAGAGQLRRGGAGRRPPSQIGRGVQDPQRRAAPPFNGLPTFSFGSGTSTFGKAKPGFTFSHSYQWNNNTTWTTGRHSVKFGGDVRRLHVETALGFTGSDNYGNTSYDGRFSGRDLGDFMLGLPYGSNYASVNQDNDGMAWHHALYIQDSFKATSKLSLEFGLRWELHPPFDDRGGNLTNFDRSVPITGRVFIPSLKRATEITAPGFLLTINACPAAAVQGLPCTPFLTAKDAGFPEGLRATQWYNFNPRFGFAYRPFGDTRTVIRGSAGRYTMTVLGGVFYGLTGISSSDVREFTNTITGGVPLFQLPNIVAPGQRGPRRAAWGRPTSARRKTHPIRILTPTSGTSAWSATWAGTPGFAFPTSRCVRCRCRGRLT